MIKLMKKYLLIFKFILSIFIILSLLSWSINFFNPYIMSKYLDMLVSYPSISSIKNFSILVLVLGISNVLLAYINNLIFVNFQTKISFKLNYDVIEHLKKVPLEYTQKYSSSYLTQRISVDSSNLTSFILNNIINIITKTLTIIICLYILLKINIYISIIILFFSIIYLIIYLISKNKLFTEGILLKEKQNEFFSKMENQIKTFKEIKIHSNFILSSKIINNSFSSMFFQLFKFTKISAIYSGFDSMIRSISLCIIFFISGIEIFKGYMTIGEFTIVNTYFSMIIECISYFLNFGKFYQDANNSFFRLKELFDLPKELNGEETLNSIFKIDIKDLSFGYSEYLLEKFSYLFEKGNIYYIHGSNGKGKTTLINLILGIIENYKGNILFNNINIKNLDMYLVRKNLIGIVLQEPSLINETIYNNLTNFNEFEDSYLKFYCDKFNLNTDNLNSDILDKSSNISGGEKQKIAIISMLIKNPDILILDEPTSALDVLSINNLKESLTELKNNKIIILISHDENLNSIADFNIYL